MSTPLSTPTAHRPEEPEAPVPTVVDRAAWDAAYERLLVREKAHTHAGDALAAARRRMPMTEVPVVDVVGPQGPVSLLDLFDGRDQLVVYKHMAHVGEPLSHQCEGCTLSVSGVHEPSYLHARGLSLAVLFEGPWELARELRDFMGYTVPWYSVAEVDEPTFGADFGEWLWLLRRGQSVYLTYRVTGRGTEAIVPSTQLIDRGVYGRGERWEDSPAHWPQPHGPGGFWRVEGRPTPQWARLAAGAVDTHHAATAHGVEHAHAHER
ncbi:DUF899 family protein [Xylanimonas ulmi]|uniref:Putative dithiol-disulfide oxidoreductase (DUF899 family) n=1 Tax=Xylanimonas ulmi TaxID=228973 RepID=A0A4Q7M0M5_9MICO|nr:DUF899 family protein [Xylanibacterium ulmi]RZS60914.1 putative dithiol-disulfide oxidoreductase (DUF899 family) [Xylanibacterium ulmi]